MDRRKIIESGVDLDFLLHEQSVLPDHDHTHAVGHEVPPRRRQGPTANTPSGIARVLDDNEPNSPVTVQFDNF